MNFIMWFIITLIVLVPFYFIRCVVVKEATGVTFKMLGRYVYAAIELDGYHLEPDGEIQAGPGPNSNGNCPYIWRVFGLVFYIDPLVQPTVYGDHNADDHFGGGIYVHLNDISYRPAVVDAETKAPENAPLNVKCVVTSRVTNLYKWQYRSPKNVNAEVVARIKIALRAWVKAGNEEHAQSAKGDGEKLWRELMQLPTNPADPNDPALNCGPLFQRIEDEWGMQIIPMTLTVEEIGYAPGYQEALQAKAKAKLVVGARVEETAGRIEASVARELGLTVDELKDKLKKPGFARSEAYRNALKFHKDLLKRDSAGEKGELLDVRFGSTDGENLPENIQTVAVGGGGMGVLAGGGNKRNRNNQGNNQRGGNRGGNQRGGNQRNDAGNNSPADNPQSGDSDPEADYL